MRTIYKIAKAELQNLFYSPIAWLIIILFTFQTGMTITGVFANLARMKALGYELYDITADIFGGRGSLFLVVQQYLYLYIPLLTMGLMSREFSSGSIKLYYSSPVTNVQLILGKYLSMMLYSLLLMGILVFYALLAFFLVKDFDWPVALSGLLGIYLLVCTYAAIGLFMSSLTSYQVVAAIGTLAILSVLNFVGGMWQDIAFVRDLTYWLSISGRSSEFIQGLICSEDLLYFVIVIILFLSLTVLHLQSCRQKNNRSVIWGKYLLVITLCMLTGYLSSRPACRFFYDTTRTKSRTLTPNSQEIVRKVDGKLTITTYTNLLGAHSMLAMPDQINRDLDRFKQYLRFKPDIKMKYVYYYRDVGNPSLQSRFPDMTEKERAQKLAETLGLDFSLFISPEEMDRQIDLSDEEYRFVRILERENGQRSVLRVFDDGYVHPSESEISVAFRNLTTKLPKVGFLHGHGERDNHSSGEIDYGKFAQFKPFRYSLINQGLEFTDVYLEQEVATDISLIIISDLKKPLTPVEAEHLDHYIARGGNLMILGEPRRQKDMNPILARFGVEFMPGLAVNNLAGISPDKILASTSPEAVPLAYLFKQMKAWKTKVTMPGCTSIRFTADEGYRKIPLLVTDTTGSWNEVETTDFIDDTVRLNAAAGETEASQTVAVALTREVAGKHQKIVITGDSDWLSNSLTDDFGNYSFLAAVCSWITDNQVPIDISRPRPTDNDICLTQPQAKALKWLLMGGLPALLLIVSLIIGIRRRGR